MTKQLRIGFGYDFHRLVEGRQLILGGVQIPWDKGLLAHSDGDVLAHAIGDAILGASGKRDIGTQFPDNDQRYKGISSMVLLKKIMKITEFKISNIDSVMLCEAPKLMTYIPQMQKNLAEALSCDARCVSVKAKTHEETGPIGRGEGITAYAVVMGYVR